MSIEKKTKMYDIIRQHPDFGPKRISEMLNTEKYGFLEVSPNLIYEELKRAKLNTRRQREMFVQRGGKRRLKPPGTPLLTLDGEVMVGFRSEEQPEFMQPFTPKIPVGKDSGKEKIISVKGKRITRVIEQNEEEKEIISEELNFDLERKQNTLDDEKNDENDKDIAEEIDKKERDID